MFGNNVSGSQASLSVFACREAVERLSPDRATSLRLRPVAREPTVAASLRQQRPPTHNPDHESGGVKPREKQPACG